MVAFFFFLKLWLLTVKRLCGEKSILSSQSCSDERQRKRKTGRLPIALSSFLSLVLCLLSSVPFCVRIQVPFQGLASELLSFLKTAAEW